MSRLTSLACRQLDLSASPIDRENDQFNRNYLTVHCLLLAGWLERLEELPDEEWTWVTEPAAATLDLLAEALTEDPPEALTEDPPEAL